LFGTSEDMVVRAWKFLEDGDTDRAVRQARATIEEWSSWAQEQQAAKTRRFGRLMEYGGAPRGREEIFRYWALNDVGAALFILGKALDEKKRYGEAAEAFGQLAKDFSLAQVWDPRGWFWSPLVSIRDEYLARHPYRYRRIRQPLMT